MNRFTNRVASFLADQRGNVLMLTGLCIIVLMTAAGMAIDLGRQQLVRLKLQQATDATALAAATMPGNLSDEEKRNAALTIFNMNYPSDYLGSGTVTPHIVLGSNITVTASINQGLSTTFMQVAGISSLSANASTTVSGDNTVQYYDMILALDNSASMGFELNSESSNPSWPRMTALKNATNTLIGELLGDNGTENRVAIVRWDNSLIATHPFSQNAGALHTIVNSMVPQGNTNSLIGMAALQTMGAQPPPNGYSDAPKVKAALLFTDGQNIIYRHKLNGNPLTAADVDGKNVLPTGKGQFGWTCPARRQRVVDINNLTLAQCQALKAQGVVVYTVGLSLGLGTAPDDCPNAPGTLQPEEFLAQCASGDPATNANQFFFLADNEEELLKAFETISDNLKGIRITD
jgi:Flp pilus assembly protein TadG